MRCKISTLLLKSNFLTFKIKTIRQLRRQREADEFSSVPLPSCHCIALTVFWGYFKRLGINAGFSPLHPPPLQKADFRGFTHYHSLSSIISKKLSTLENACRICYNASRQNETNVQLDKRKTHEVATRGFFYSV